jgi:hypothetical protein
MWPTLGARLLVPLYLRAHDAHQRKLISHEGDDGSHMVACLASAIVARTGALFPLFGIDFPQSGD